MQEIWKDIEGYEGYYQVSDMGNVRSVDRYVSHTHSNRLFCPGCLIKTKITKKGYEFVNLTRNGKHRTFQVHRLVALAFIPNDKGLPEINHINCIRNDNRAENLEWCDRAYNCNWHA